MQSREKNCQLGIAKPSEVRAAIMLSMPQDIISIGDAIVLDTTLATAENCGELCNMIMAWVAAMLNLRFNDLDQLYIATGNGRIEAESPESIADREAIRGVLGL